MELSISLECPQCGTTFPLPLSDFSPGRRKTCERCQSPVQLTAASLLRLTDDLRCFCES